MSTDIPRFNDQQKGTVTFVVWKEHLAIYAGELGGETAKKILFGKISGIRATEGGAREYTIPSSRGAATIYTSYGRIQQPAQQQQQHASTRSTARELQNAGAQLGTWLGELWA